MAGERIAWVDIARIIAIALIVGFHVAYEFTLDPGLRPIGFFGASLFFIASGYMLSAKYPELIRFDLGWLKKRWLRIASLYYPALICMSLLFADQDIYSRIRDLILHFLFLNWASPDTSYSIISPAWFLIPLMGLYILFPFLNRLMKKSAWFLLPALLLAIANRFLLPGTWTDFSPVFFLGEFCFGIATTKVQWHLGAPQPKAAIVAQGERRQSCSSQRTWCPVFAGKRTRGWLVLGLALLPAVVNPLMVVPFALFLLLGLLGKGIVALPNPMDVVAANTFEIFLFHESVMKVALGKWSVLQQNVAASLAILAIALAVVKLASQRLALYFFHK